MKSANLICLLAIGFAAFIVFFGCKPKPISGQLYLTGGTGIAVPVPNVQILLIDAKEAADFLAQKKLESQMKCEPLKVRVKKLESDNVQNELDYETLKRTNSAYLLSESYTNDSRYVSLMIDSSNCIHTAEVMDKAIAYLKSKYGENPFNGMNPINRYYSREQLNAFAAEREDFQRLSELQQQAVSIDHGLDGFREKVRRESGWGEQTALGKVERIKSEISDDTASLSKYQQSDFYFGGFSPHVIEMSLTDEKGGFVVNPSRPNAKIFAKIVLDDSTNGLFWLMDLPNKNEKLILSDVNIFNVPTQN